MKLKKIIISLIIIMLIASYIPVGITQVKAKETDEEGVVIENKYETVEDYLKDWGFKAVKDDNGEIIEIELYCFRNEGQIKDLTGLYKYSNLTKLTLTNIRNIDIDFTKFPKLKTLEIKFGNIINDNEILEKTLNLEKLHIEDTVLLKSEGKLDISKMTNLKELVLDRLYIDRIEYEPIEIIGIENLTKLEKLKLCDVILEKELDLSSFEKLQDVNIDCIEEETHDYDADNEAQLNELAEIVRDRMTNREEEFAVTIFYTYRRKKPYEISQVWEWILERACSKEFYQNSDHGDYLEQSLAEGSSCTCLTLGKEAVENKRERYMLQLRYNLKYNSTKEEEDILNAGIEEWIKTNINTEKDTDIEKIKKIYNYITSNVNYDYTYQKRSAYNAFIEGEAVCEGYAKLLYKMLKMSGIDNVKIITGNAYNGQATERHAWNLLEIDGKYYYLDATWDAGLHGDTEMNVEDMTYFLNGSDSFDKDHFPDEGKIDQDYDISLESYFKEEVKDDEEEAKSYINTTSNLKEKNVNDTSIIIGVDFNTNILDFINQNNFNLEYSLKIFDKQEQEVSIDDLITTGSKVKLYKDNQLEKEYTVVIYGDVNGDGQITPVDALTLIKAINKKIQYANPMCEQAGKILTTEENKSPSARDALAIIKHLNNKYEIQQSV